jgi:bacteriochlorophyllide a dehydrogenase
MRSSALVMTGPCAVELHEYELPEPNADDVVIRTEYSGVSQGTEVDAYRGERPELAFPTVTGYQSVGIVEWTGDAVTGMAVGDRVLFTTSRLPDRYPFTWMAGHVSRAVVSTSSRAPIVVPGVVDPVGAALTAMVAVGLGGLQQIRVELGDVVLVSGQGLIGHSSAQLARCRGAVVVTTDLSPTRVELSRLHSADLALDVGRDDVDGTLAGVAPDGVDVVIETSGRADQVAPSIERLRTGGTLLLQGYYKQQIQLDFHPTHIKKPTIAAACGLGDLRMALDLVRWGKVDLSGLVTHLTPPEQGADLFARMAANDPEVLGVVFDWGRLDG